jgi:hypothetical protein
MNNPSTRGRKPRHPVDACRTAFWAWTVREQMGKSLDEIERQFNPDGYRKRDDTGGYSQSGRWRTYGKGKSDPVGSHQSKLKTGTHLELAAAQVPYSLDIYNSVLWHVLKATHVTDAQTEVWINDLEPQTALRLMCYFPYGSCPWESFLRLDSHALADFAAYRTPDVLAVLLLYCYQRWPLPPSLQIRVMVREWLASTIQHLIPFRKTEHLLLPALEAMPLGLGSMTGRYALSTTKSADRQYKDAIFANQESILKDAMDQHTRIICSIKERNHSAHKFEVAKSGFGQTYK